MLIVFAGIGAVLTLAGALAWAWLGLGWLRERRRPAPRPERDPVRELFDIVEW